MPVKNYLFVYGTLRNTYNLKLKDKVSKELEYLGSAKIGASLYDLGKYPGVVREDKKSEVIGDVFIVNNPLKVFGILDKYEGNEFTRTRKRVHLKSGKSINAWIYWYNRNPEGKQRIRQKDYLNYLKSKKTA